jgi:hypothetical protein
MDSTPKSAQKYTKFFTQNKIRNSDCWIFYGKEGLLRNKYFNLQYYLFTGI